MRRVAFVVLLISRRLAAQPPAYDLVLRNGRIVDGTGSPWYRADVAIRGDTIVRIAPPIAGRRPRATIDVGGLVVAPGFIDIHTHARRGIFEVPTADNYVRQGVTTLDRRAGRQLAGSAAAVPRQGGRRRASRRTSPASSARARCAARSSAKSIARRRPTSSRRCARSSGRAWRTARSA